MDVLYPTGPRGQEALEELVKAARLAGRGLKYDLIVGLSGGCDSSYLLHVAKSYGLRPLAVHFDNTWNSRIAVENIQNMVTQLEVDLFTVVADSEEYCDVFRSLLHASVPEGEAANDLALATTHYLACEKYGVKYIWEGHSFRTEGVTPPGWFYLDARYIDGIQRQFGKIYPIPSIPLLWLSKWLKWMVFDKIKKVRPLYYLDYHKEQTVQFLTQKYGWQWYGGHHLENRTAAFCYNYYLPKKFGIDLRWCEFAALVRSGQMTREEAFLKLQTPKPFDDSILEELKFRLGLSEEEFSALFQQPLKSFRDYRTYKQVFIRLRPFFYLLLKANYITKTFYDKFTLPN